MKRITRILKNMVWKSEMIALEFGIAVYTIGAGIWFINPFINTFESRGQVYQYVSSLMSQEVWGAILLFVGFLNLVLLSGERGRLYKYATLCTVFFWVWVATMFANANIQAWLFYNACAGAALYVWIHLRVSREIRVRHEVKREVASCIDTTAL